MRKLIFLGFVLIAGIFVFYYWQQGQSKLENEAFVQKGELKLKSSAFEHNGKIPDKYTCDGENLSPPLSISEVPKEAKSLALIVDDPDAPGGDFVHWVMWNIDPETKEIPEAGNPTGAVQGLSGFVKKGYGGPCPPFGVHRYQFKLYALDTVLELSDSSGKDTLIEVFSGHVLAQTLLIGTYERV